MCVNLVAKLHSAYLLMVFVSLMEIGGAASFEVRQAYKQFIAGVVGLVDREVPSEELGEVALTICRLFREEKGENDHDCTAKNK